MLWDYRTYHSGTANRSDHVRPMVYATYARRWYQDPVNFPEGNAAAAGLRDPWLHPWPARRDSVLSSRMCGRPADARIAGASGVCRRCASEAVRIVAARKRSGASSKLSMSTGGAGSRPFASIGSGRWDDGEASSISDGAADREKRRLDEDGYFRLRQVFDSARIARMRRIVEAVRRRRLARGFRLRLRRFLDHCPFAPDCLVPRQGAGRSLSSEHRSSGRIGCPANGASPGWSPHEDYRDVGDTFLSVWIPLSDATVENGCIVPATWRIVARDFDGHGGTPRPAADGFSARAGRT